MKKLAQKKPELFAWLILGASLPIRPDTTPLPSLERTPDFVGIVSPGRPDAFVIHLEFEAARASGVVARLELVNNLLAFEHELPVLSAVVRLRGRRRALHWRERQRHLPPGGSLGRALIASFRWLELNCRSVEDDVLFAAPNVAALALVPLTARGSEPAVLERAVGRIVHAASPQERAELLTVLAILAGLRNVRREVITRMARSFMAEKNWVIDMIKRAGVREGKELGRAVGEKRGLAVGEKRGEKRGLARTITAIVRRRFGPLDPEARARVAALCERSTLALLTDAALAATDLDDFARRAQPRRVRATGRRSRS